MPKLVEKAYELKQNIKIQTSTDEQAEEVNDLLWSYKDYSFLPHGSKKNGHAKKHPIWIASDYKNPNNATLLFLTGGAKLVEGDFERIFVIFDANNPEELEQARWFYKELKAKDVELSYWQQTQNGWTKK